jgi:microcystin-dependent protein
VGEPFIGEIRTIGYDFAPKGWAFCSGQLLPINQNQALFSILGTTYGGDGRTTFALPDLRGRAPLHTGSLPLGQPGGEETHTLTLAELPPHTHQVSASNQVATLDDPAGAAWAALSAGNLYSTAPPNTAMHAGSVTTVGNSGPHQNMQPYLVVNFIIALVGIYPSRS